MNPRNPTTRQVAPTMDSRALGRALVARVWNDERVFLAALTLFNLFLARRTFGAGIWADNDSVCHYAYVRHLLEDILPATGTFLGWTPKYDLGAPFLLDGGKSQVEMKKREHRQRRARRHFAVA